MVACLRNPGCDQEAECPKETSTSGATETTNACGVKEEMAATSRSIAKNKSKKPARKHE